MKRRGSGLVFGMIAFLALGPSAPRADVIQGARCAAAKLKAAGKAVDAVLACQAKRAITGFGDSNCFHKAAQKLVHAFEAAETRGACAGNLDTIQTILKDAIDATVFELLPDSCTLQANRNGSVMCAQHPALPQCPACILKHVDDFDRGRALYFCTCG